MAKNESTAINDLIHVSHGKIVEVAAEDNLFVTERRLPGMPPPMPRKRAPAATPAPAIQEAIAQMPPVEYADETTDATEIDGPQKKWLDSIETIPFDPSMRVYDLGEGTPPRAVAPVRVDAVVRAQATPRPARRQTQGTPRPQPRVQTQAPPRAPQRPIARHPHDNIPTRLNHVDVAGGHVSYSPDPDVASYGNDTDIAPLSAIPTPPPSRAPVPLHAPYGAPALPPHVPTAMALPPQAVMPTQVAQHIPPQVAQAYPALVRPYQDGVTPYPIPRWATGQHPIPGAPLAAPSPYHVPPNHLDIYADTEERARRSSNTGPTPSLRPSLGRYLLPFMGGTALLVFVVGYFAMRGDGAAKSPEVAPVASAAVMPVKAAPVAAPIVSEIVEPQLPEPSWKNRAATPTIVAAAEPAPVEQPAAEPADEIEMAPVATKAAPAKIATKKSSSSSRRAKRAEIAAIAKSNAKASKPAIEVPASKPAAKAKSTEKAIAKSAKTTRDPILEEIEKPAKATEAKTGPGKLVISSSVPTLIYIDGRSTNLMTPKTLNLSAGTHKITLLELKSRKAKTMDIEIAAGTVSKVDKKF